MTTTTLHQLPDGRHLAAAEYGDPNGDPVIYFHGCPSSRIEGDFWHDAAAEHGYRIIAFDRPGCGRSDPKPNRTVIDIADDVQALTDTLGIDRFGLIATSGGMPFLAACAARIPRQITFAVDCAGWIQLAEVNDHFDDMAPGDKLFGTIAVRAPWLLRGPFVFMRLVVRHVGAAGFRRIFASWASDRDQGYMNDEELVTRIMAVTQESFRQGSKGPTDDALLCFRDWGFRLHQITIPVSIHHGLDDKMVVPGFSRHAAAAIPNATLTTYPDAGHYGLLINAPTHILANLRTAAGCHPEARPPAG